MRHVGPSPVDVRARHAEAQCSTAAVKRPRVCCPLGLCLVPTLQALADAFRVNKTIKGVYLDRNQIGNEGVKAETLQQGHGGGAVERGEPSFLHTQRHPFIMSWVWDFCSISWFVSIFFLGS